MNSLFNKIKRYKGSLFIALILLLLTFSLVSPVVRAEEGAAQDSRIKGNENARSGQSMRNRNDIDAAFEDMRESAKIKAKERAEIGRAHV